MTALTAAQGRFSRWGVSNAKMVGESILPQSGRGWILFLLGLAILPALLYFGSAWYTSRLERARTEGAQAAQVAMAKLRTDLATANAELRRKQLVLDAEILRKKELAVLYERAEAARKQAVADHAAALAQLKALQAKQSSQRKR
jgi:hypothetical protein